MSRVAHGPTQSPIQCAPVKGSEGVKLTTRLPLVPRLIMSRAIPLLPLYAFTVWTETTLPLWNVTIEPSVQLLILKSTCVRILRMCIYCSLMQNVHITEVNMK